MEEVPLTSSSAFLGHGANEDLEQQQRERQFESQGRRGKLRRWAVVAVSGAAVMGLGAALATASRGKHGGQGVALPADVDAIEEKMIFQKTTPAERPNSAEEKEQKRKKMRVEHDLGMFVNMRSMGRGASMLPSSGSHCIQQASALFDNVAMHSGLDKELDPEELQAFKARFDAHMEDGCRDDPLFTNKASHWIEEAKQALEQQKPVMTNALAQNLNRADYGFKVEMKNWMVNESNANFGMRLGRTARPADAKITQPKAPHGRMGGFLPPSFNSAEHWPECATEILRVHNQGICGSCWSFSCTQVLDARICIRSGGQFNGTDAQLSPGYFASCAAGYDGCGGGWEYFCYEYIDKVGTPGGVSETCSPYFGTGSGVNHFTQRSNAPACPTDCQEGYSRNLAEDGFKLPGIGAYKMFMPAGPSAHMEAKRAILSGGMVNHGIYAMGHFMGYSGGVYNLCTGYDANHAVVTYGWFPGGYLSKNSWGEDWGENGTMRLADCMITDFTIPGDFDAQDAIIPYPLGHLR